MTDDITNTEKIKSIFFDYAQGTNWLEISANEFVDLKDLTKN